jgi:hypothetical protein
MSIGSLGIIGGLAGAPLPQRTAEAEKTQREAADQARAAQAAERAEQAAGIGQTEEDAQANDRDADGRRPWEHPPTPEKRPEQPDAVNDPQHGRSKDPSGVCGGQLDLDG